MHKKLRNPFYLLAMAAGAAFGITACAYFVMTLWMLEPDRLAEQPAGSRGLMEFMDDHGATMMLVEVGVLAVATLLAIATDGFWTRLAEGKVEEKNLPLSERRID